MKPRKSPLKDYPLAVQYGWGEPKSTLGGSLYLYPPSSSTYDKNGFNKTFLNRHALEAIDPRDLTPLARQGAIRYTEHAPMREIRPLKMQSPP